MPSPRSSPLVVLLLAMAPLAAMASCTPFPSADFGAADQPAYRSVYRNPEFGYGIAVPSGFVAYGAAQPGPNHGVGILLRLEPRGYVWVDGGYNVFDGVRSAKDYLDMQERPPNPGETVLALQRSGTRLGGERGMLQLKRYRCGPTGPARVQHLAVVVAHGMVYVVGLDTSATNDRLDVRVFSSLISTWRFHP